MTNCDDIIRFPQQNSQRTKPFAYQSLKTYDSRILNTFEQLTNERLKWALAIAETCFEPGGAMVRAASIDASA